MADSWPMEVDAPPAAPRYSYETPWTMYSLAWCAHSPSPIRLGVGSYLETEVNKVQVLEVNEETQRLEMVAEADHPFVSTKLMWDPRLQGDSGPSLLASTSTTLNVWKYEDAHLTPMAKLANARTKSMGGHTPPLTSFDWSRITHDKIGASSVDSTCTIWNLEKQKIETQLIAHDKAVHDIVFSQKDCLFASVGADGSVRLFDQRNLDHSTIIYEAPSASPLLRLAWNRIDTYHIATIAMDNPGVILIDIRRPSVALSALSSHDSVINHITWAPHTASHLLCGTDDGFALIWDVKSPEGSRDAARRKPNDKSAVFWHDCDHEIYQVQWPTSAPDHVGLGTSNRVDIVQL